MSKENTSKKIWEKPELTEESVKETKQVDLPAAPTQTTS